MSLGLGLRTAARSLRKSRGFSIVAIAVFALAIGAATAVLSVARAVLSRDLPLPQPEEIVVIWERNEKEGHSRMFSSPPNVADWAAAARSFEGIGAYVHRDFTLSGGGDPAPVFAARVSPGFLRMVGAEPLLGRVFTEEEERPGEPTAVILANDLWKSRYGADPNILGKTVRLDGLERTVVGVMPPSFGFPPPLVLEGAPPVRRPQLWIPLGTDLAGGQRGARHLVAVGRLRQGVGLESAERDLSAVAARLAREHPDTNEGWGVRVHPFVAEWTQTSRPALRSLSGAVALVLLLCCANLVNLALGRNIGRRREFAVRSALGAGKARLASLLLAEQTLLASAGAVLAGGLAWAGVHLVGSLGAAGVPRLEEARVDWGLLLAAAAFCALVTTVFTALPLLIDRTPEASRLTARGGGEPRTRRLRSALVVFEIVLATIVLAGTVLLLRSLQKLVEVDPGFRAEQALTFRTYLAGARYGEGLPRVAAVEAIERRLAGLPGVVRVAAATHLPMIDEWEGTPVSILGKESPRRQGETTGANFVFVTPGYLRAMGASLREGREFESKDDSKSPAVVVVNEAFVRRFLGSERALGRTVHLGFEGGTPREIVGVAADLKHLGVAEAVAPSVFVPYFQRPVFRALAFTVRFEVGAAPSARQIRETLAAVDPDLAILDLQPLRDVVARSLSRPRFAGLLFAGFGGAAMLLAAIGLYGVVSYSVRRRMAEFGIRIALGAQRGNIRSLVLREGLRVTAVGLGIGLLAALLVGRLLGSLLFGVKPADPVAFGAVAVLLAISSLLACLIPARRAVRVNPIEALRSE